MKLFKVILLLVAFTFSFTMKAHAHPHNWIDVKTQFTLNDESHLTHIKQTWEFDIYYSMMTLADILDEHDSEEIGLPIMSTQMINNLKSYNYFSELNVNGKSIQLNKPKQYELRTKKKDGHIVLELEMTFIMSSKIQVEQQKMKWLVYDPTYYISMLHQDESAITVVSKNGTECAVEIIEPEPSNELIDYAQSLDKTQKNTDGLGAKFAEKINLSCF